MRPHKEHNHQPLMRKITKAQLGWFGHVQTLCVAFYPRMALDAKVEGKRPCERSRKNRGPTSERP